MGAATSESGTKRTCRSSLAMSVVGVPDLAQDMGSHSQSITSLGRPSSGAGKARPNILSMTPMGDSVGSIEFAPFLRFLCVSYFDCSACRVVNWFTVTFTPSLVPSGPVESTV